MSSIQIAGEFKERLAASRESVELRDEEGHLVGYFVPAGEEDEELWERVRGSFTEAEIAQAIREEGDGLPLHELLETLEAQWPSK